MQIAKSVATVAAVLMVLVPLQQASAAKVRDLRFSDGRQFIGLRKQALNQLGPGATRTELHSRILSLDRGIAISSKGRRYGEARRPVATNRHSMESPYTSIRLPSSNEKAARYSMSAGRSLTIWARTLRR
jgi:hypothetical protein